MIYITTPLNIPMAPSLTTSQGTWATVRLMGMTVFPWTIGIQTPSCDELHPSEQTWRKIAEASVGVIEGRSKWASYYST